MLDQTKIAARTSYRLVVDRLCAIQSSLFLQPQTHFGAGGQVACVFNAYKEIRFRSFEPRGNWHPSKNRRPRRNQSSGHKEMTATNRYLRCFGMPLHRWSDCSATHRTASRVLALQGDSRSLARTLPRSNCGTRRPARPTYGSQALSAAPGARDAAVSDTLRGVETGDLSGHKIRYQTKIIA
jgi:hypothetical protein